MTRVAAALLLSCLALPATAESLPDVICAATPDIKQRLKLVYGAKQLGAGMFSPDQMMEVWVSDTGDWTLLRTYAGGTSCIVAMGEHFLLADPPENPA